MVARPICWGLAVAGEQGVVDVLAILRDEHENTMALSGVKRVADISASHIARR
jgi:isopentenyl diphosphate isomerase/L-lactate dehydrogenase-like FMN-dependent dehydrogenase